MLKKYLLLLFTISFLSQSRMYAQDEWALPKKTQDFNEWGSASSKTPSKASSKKKVVSFTLEPFVSLGTNMVTTEGFSNLIMVPSTSVGLATELRLWDILAFRLEGELQSQYNNSEKLDNIYFLSFNMSAGMRLYAAKSFFLGVGATGAMMDYVISSDKNYPSSGWPGIGNWYAELGSDFSLNPNNYIGFFLRYTFLGMSKDNNYYNELDQDTLKRQNSSNNTIGLYVSYGHKF